MGFLNAYLSSGLGCSHLWAGCIVDFARHAALAQNPRGRLWIG